MCLVVSINKKKLSSSYDGKKYNTHLILRGLKIFSFGMIITTVSLLFITDRPVLFGVLHCIGLCIILCVPFLKLKPIYNIISGTAIILLGTIIAMFSVENPTVIHLAVGLHQANIGQYTIDYFPLFPWLGMTLLGVALGSWLYKDNKRRFRIPDLPKYKPVNAFLWMGKHSLVIYLLHQPIIAGLLSVFITI